MNDNKVIQVLLWGVFIPIVALVVAVIILRALGI